MTYQVLARKWRPKDLSQVVGQAHVCQALTHALSRNRLHHAYLFTGTRGVGKTTLARILAKSLNCEQGPTPTPCGVCQACLQIDVGQYIDVIEVDAASRTKVEETRDLLDNVPYAPVNARYKIYLIDEVHMLSTHSFNALLKTLEEPPSHVKFFLATTDPEKLPVTILSRCLQFHLKRIEDGKIVQHLEHILDTDGVVYEKAALSAIAKASEGSMRDALSLLEQGLSYAEAELTASAVLEMLGVVRKESIFDILSAVLDANVAALLQLSKQYSEEGADFGHVIDQLLAVIHSLSVVQLVPDAAGYDADESESMSRFINQFTSEQLQLMYQLLLVGKRDFALAVDPKSGFEMLMIRLAVFQKKPIESVKATISTQSVQAKEPLATPQAKQSKPVVIAASENKNSTHHAVSDNSQPTWSELVAALPLTALNRVLIQHCSLVSWNNDQIHLSLDPKQSACYQPERVMQIQTSISEYLKKPVKVNIKLSDKALSDTPAAKKVADIRQKQDKAHQDAHADPAIQSLINTFDATIEHIQSIDKKES